MENKMTQYLVIIHIFVDDYRSRVFAKSLQYTIECGNGKELLDNLNKLEDEAIEDYCGGDIDRKSAHRAGIHQVMIL